MKLYDYVLSGNCYKIRLLATFLDIDYEAVAVDFYPGREHKSAAFLKLNPLGQIPVLEDDGLIIRDAQAILLYLANKYDTAKRGGRPTIRNGSAKSPCGWHSPIR